jgi:FSR family fosmidomycin resistance protein-like MFS transporter
MTTAFPWKHGALALAAVCAVAAGKALGGILAERFGMSRVTICSLGMSAVAFSLRDIPVFGLLALLCFNMTMPLTLFALWRRFPGYPGTVFGALTLALFVGFLPAYFGIDLPVGGVLGSILSLALLWRAVDHV